MYQLQTTSSNTAVASLINKTVAETRIHDI